jgi:excisionase family DNA binding protein
VILSPSDWCDTRAVFRIAVLPILIKLPGMSMAFQNFLTPTEAASVIGCTDGRVRQLLRDGKLSGEKIGVRMWLIPEGEAQKMRDLPAETGRPRKNKKCD